MNTFIKTAFLYFNKIKVVHSIPGRLRLQIPGLDKVPEEMRKYEHYTTSLIKMHKGIKEISYSYVTGKLLVIYDKDITDEKKILDWLNFVWKKVVDNEDVYNKLTPEEIEKNLDRFYEMLCSELKKGR